MFYRKITDWDDAYANGANIPGGERWPQAWVEPARAYRERLAAEGRAELDVAYGEGARNRFDLFRPEGKPAGLVVFIHGGFWLKLDKSFWSHLAAGAVDSGYAVAMPSYTLCPENTISGITAEIGLAVTAAAERIDGPLLLTGHSAGGHLATRMACTDSPLPAPVRARLRHVLSISGVHDLRPMMRTAMNEGLKIDEREALAESPALLSPLPDLRLTCWAGASERGEFLRQNALLANVWTGLGAVTAVVEEPDRHHFDVIDGLADSQHQMVRCLLTA
ncbi:alpha/beta hydrolase [Nitratireductor sp. ZSWI3]|uniref:alpha/beta hydrolase n=1 Tax=Nitratireductor sp. ZSWI3 TaxID=2966359 RepID=UPI0021501739|nr:alpha/beta hydrolase [Nitratireductor sp. ZSWI3]MCR4266973.1 alpha/beta hydrolase [Nitratireductor sp. ZSWI3]